jgi:hypothetical protein
MLNELDRDALWEDQLIAEAGREGCYLKERRWVGDIRQTARNVARNGSEPQRRNDDGCGTARFRPSSRQGQRKLLDDRTEAGLNDIEGENERKAVDRITNGRDNVGGVRR